MSLKKFAFVAGDDVFTVWSIDPETSSDTEIATRIVAGLQSNPKVVDITELTDLNIGLGWTYNGTDFIPPTE